MQMAWLLRAWAAFSDSFTFCLSVGLIGSGGAAFVQPFVHWCVCVCVHVCGHTLCAGVHKETRGDPGSLRHIPP